MNEKNNAQNNNGKNVWKKGGRGRPPFFQTKAQQQEAIKQIKIHGVTGAATLLGVSRPVLQRLAKVFKIKLKSGRRPATTK